MLRPIGLLLATLRGLVAAAILVHDLVAYIGRPLWRLLARIRLLAWLSGWVATLPPWGVLVAVSIPFAVAEPLKLWGLYALATGHTLSGIGLLVVGYALSLVLAERIMHAGKAQLMTYRWFALAWGWFERFHAYVLALPIIVATRRVIARFVSRMRAARDTAISHLRHLAGL